MGDELTDLSQYVREVVPVPIDLTFGLEERLESAVAVLPVKYVWLLMPLSGVVIDDRRPR